MLCKEKVLCADKLFKCRRQQDRSVPQKGGAKDYAPDGSWLQAKRLEAFHQERTAVLAEPRVERLGGLVQGTWDPNRKLVQFKKEMGKFWSHMGFVDESRKWLFPEEALFLMETTVLEVYYGGVPLSIQEAYVRLLGEDVSVEEYQTYAHLRRLGYVVLRHVGGSQITEYERQIKLDQHVKESKRRLHRDRQEEVFAVDAEVKKPRIDPQQVEMDQSPGGRELKCVAMDTGSGRDAEYKESSDAVKVKMDSGQMVVVDSDVQQNNHPSFAKLSNPWNLPHKSEGKVPVRHSEWDFETFAFPDIGDKETVVLSIPLTKYLPVNVTLSEEYEDLCLFDVTEYRQQVSQFAQRRRESDNYVFDLNFSYSTWARNRKNIAAANWTEYKLKLRQSQSGRSVPSPVDHLWQGEVTPLVKPEDATSTRDVLSRLQVIHSVNLPQPVSKSDRHSMKISFDVHLPNARFKKTRPGLPNHRVCVVRSSDPPPAMADISDAVTRYHDNVPVNWAVVDNGDIAFYNMSSMLLPVDVMMG
ncbi:tRNA-splicing endonuclease subunit Sen54-like [Haliotis rubra]|uniref:tRNA-splicing endonuclease subunit Sen54-like n=1 Tax=Haliotis rubra TaxID=36100 RepID=UPI001EE5CDFB|nr:tRNA-splicing endonuclease subunit Sen54-like [Haliotis rubra]